MSDITETDQPLPDAASPAPTALQRYGVPAALLVAVVAIVLAIWAVTNAHSDRSEALTSSASSGSEAIKLPGDPKTRVCGAYDTVSNAVNRQFHVNLGNTPTAKAAASVNVQLALLGGGQYLLNQLDAATPSELADAVRSYADQLQQIGVNGLAGSANGDPAQTERMTKADSAKNQIVEMCK